MLSEARWLARRMADAVEEDARLQVRAAPPPDTARLPAARRLLLGLVCSTTRANQPASQAA